MMTTAEKKELAREVKRITGRPMNSFEVTGCGHNVIFIKYFKSNYDRVTNNYTYEDVYTK